MNQPAIAVIGGFDNIRSRHLRFLEEASKLGAVTVLLWPDEALQALTGEPPRFPLAERRYFLEAVRYVDRVSTLSTGLDPDQLPVIAGFHPGIWVDVECRANSARESNARMQGVEYRVIQASQIAGFPEAGPLSGPGGRKKVMVTGCYDWFHSGHVRFFEEASQLGELHAVVGNDANLRLLKGPGHPLLPQAERRYMVGTIRHVKQSLISTGEGWLDAEPEMRRLRPDIYVVNEDGDKGGKRELCERMGIEYRVLKRAPAPGLPPRTSTVLRGF
jgi:cytidyltransferase-like protein